MLQGWKGINRTTIGFDNSPLSVPGTTIIYGTRATLHCLRPVSGSLPSRGARSGLRGLDVIPIMVSIEDDNGIFVDTGCLQIIKEGLYRGIKIIGGSKVSMMVSSLVFCQWESNLIPYQTGCVRIVVGNCDEFGIEGEAACKCSKYWMESANMILSFKPYWKEFSSVAGEK